MWAAKEDLFASFLFFLYIVLLRIAVGFAPYKHAYIHTIYTMTWYNLKLLAICVKSKLNFSGYIKRESISHNVILKKGISIYVIILAVAVVAIVW